MSSRLIMKVDILGFLLIILGYKLSRAQLHNYSSCDADAQRAINQCAQELRQLGVFTQNQGQVDALTWEQIRRRSRDYFKQICVAYGQFNQCIDRGNYKFKCWPEEPVKAQYAVADAALDYVCGQGYYGMVNSWDCFLQAATRTDVIQCEARILQDAQSGTSSDLRQGERACKYGKKKSLDFQIQNSRSCIGTVSNLYL